MYPEAPVTRQRKGDDMLSSVTRARQGDHGRRDGLAVHFIQADPYPPKGRTQDLVQADRRQSGSIYLRASDQSGNRSHGLQYRVWVTGPGTACQLFFLATAALRTVANAVHAISGTASAAAA